MATVKNKPKHQRLGLGKSKEFHKIKKHDEGCLGDTVSPSKMKEAGQNSKENVSLKSISQANSIPPTTPVSTSKPASVTSKALSNNPRTSKQPEPSVKKRKYHKKKGKNDGLSNWKSLCSSMHMDAKRKKQPMKRKQEAAPVEEEPFKKSAHPEIWFDNVDEILLDLPTDELTPNDVSSENTHNARTKRKSDDEATNKLVKVDSFPGVTNCVAMDCEMVGVGETGEESVLARVSLVNHYGVCLYDKFVLPREQVTDYRTHVSGVTKENLATGEDFSTVQKEVSDLVRGRILVGHALHNDLKVLFLTHPHTDIRDTSKYKPFRELFGGRIPALKKLTDKLLNVSVQEGQHSSVQDAQATMRLYTMFRQRWEKEIKSKRKVNKKKNPKNKKKKVLSRQTS